jgi:hypothetical protein
MSKKYGIHSDFSRFPVITLKFGAAQMWLINTLLRLQCFFVKRSLKLALEDHAIPRPDGSRLKVFSMTPRGLVTPAAALI